MSRSRPPVIPEIAKAYQNDPRTAMALAAMKAGTSGDPVAGGGWGVTDGIARVLQGAMGGVANRQQQDAYSADQTALLAQRAQRGVDGLSGLPAAPVAPGAPMAPTPAPGAAAVASAMGAPPAAPQAPMPPPGAPMPPTAPGAPVMGGGPTRRPPFSPTSLAAPDPLGAPVMEAVPEAPKVLERPNAPTAEAPTQSRSLKAAYQIMRDANPYESAQGQDMYQSGLTEQTKLDETATERKQRLADMGYEADLGQYGDSQSQARKAGYSERENAQSHNFQAGESFKGRAFSASESGKDRAAAKAREQFSAGAAAGQQARAQRFAQQQGDRDFEHQKVLEGIKHGADRKNYAAQYLQTKAGHAQITEYAKTVNAASQQLSVLNAFDQKLPRTKTGGLLLGNAPGLVKWSSKDLTLLDGYTQQLVANNAKMLPGALSDKEGARLEAMGPSIKKGTGANQENIKFLKGVAQRQKAFALGQARALRNGEDIDFLENFSAYTDNVPVTSPVTYEQWQQSRPSYDANGNLVRK